MSYDEAIRFWYARINYEVRAAKPEDLKLERMALLLEELGNPQKQIATIHIAGTKGKGSTAAMIAAIAKSAGHKVGLFTSPHLERVEERIQIDGELIPEAELAAGMAILKPIVEAIDSKFPPVTFFEIVTALAWLHFRSQRADLAVLEVGLGGRYDSTNVCNPAATVITSIGYDHMAQLGKTLKAIAGQKAGIIKPGVPVISGVRQPGPRAVIRTEAAKHRAPLVEVTKPYPGPMNLLGDHQRLNASLAIEACQAAGIAVKAQALMTVNWPARIEVVRRSPTVILDCAHNVPSAAALVATLQSEFGHCGTRICLFAVSSDKQYREMLPVLAGYFNRFAFTRYGNNPRCVPPEQLMELVPGVDSRVIVPAAEAFEQSYKSLNQGDLLCVTGSVFLAGELKGMVQATV